MSLLQILFRNREKVHLSQLLMIQWSSRLLNRWLTVSLSLIETLIESQLQIDLILSLDPFPLSLPLLRKLGYLLHLPHGLPQTLLSFLFLNHLEHLLMLFSYLFSVLLRLGLSLKFGWLFLVILIFYEAQEMVSWFGVAGYWLLLLQGIFWESGDRTSFLTLKRFFGFDLDLGVAWL